MKCKLGDVCEIKHGYAFKGEFFCNESTNYLLVTPGNFAIGGGFQEKPKYYNGPIPDSYVLGKNDLIVTMTDLSKQGDTLGYSALVPQGGRYLHNQRIGLVSITNQCAVRDYIYWVMRTNDYQRYIVNHASGSTVKHTSPKNILSYDIDLPTLSEQRAIADTLSVLDAKIVNNKAINHHLAAWINSAAVIISGFAMPDSRKPLSPVTITSTPPAIAARRIGRSDASQIFFSTLKPTVGVGNTSNSGRAKARKFSSKPNLLGNLRLNTNRSSSRFCWQTTPWLG